MPHELHIPLPSDIARGLGPLSHFRTLSHYLEGEVQPFMSTHESKPKQVFEDVSIRDLGSGPKASIGSHDEANDESVVDDNVPAQYHGTVEDKYDMRVLGKKQVLRRHFSFTSMVGFSSTVLVAWEETPVLAIYALDNGGTAIIFWGIVGGHSAEMTPGIWLTQLPIRSLPSLGVVPSICRWLRWLLCFRLLVDSIVSSIIRPGVDQVAPC